MFTIKRSILILLQVLSYHTVAFLLQYSGHRKSSNARVNSLKLEIILLVFTLYTIQEPLEVEKHSAFINRVASTAFDLNS